MNNFFRQYSNNPTCSMVESAMDWLTSNFSVLFNAIQKSGKLLMNQVTDLLINIPAIILIVLVVIFAFFYHGQEIWTCCFFIHRPAIYL